MCRGAEWSFLNNPAQEGNLPQGQGAHAVGVVFSNATASRTVVIDLDEGELEYAEGVADFAYLDQREYERPRARPVAAWLDDAQTAATKQAVARSVASWVSVPGWPTPANAPSSAEGWVNMEGWDWTVVVCAEDYSLYRYAGSGAGPPELEGLISDLWNLTSR